MNHQINAAGIGDSFARDYAAAAAPPPSDLHSLRCQFEDLLSRARDHALRIEAIGDQIFGTLPVDNSAGQGLVPAPSSFAELMNDLDSVLTRIGYGLNRL